MQTQFKNDSDVRITILLQYRHRSENGGTAANYNQNDRFRVHRGANGALLFVYNSLVSPEAKVIADIDNALQCPTELMASGLIWADRREWQFQYSPDIDTCLQVLNKLAIDDVETLRYYGDFQMKGPHQEELGLLGHFWREN